MKREKKIKKNPLRTELKATKKEKYNYDFILWTQYTIQVLEQRNFNQLDIENLILELESLLERDRQKFNNILFELLVDLLQLQYQSKVSQKDQVLTEKNLSNSITYQRDKLQQLMNRSPSLQGLLTKCIARNYPIASSLANTEHGMEIRNVLPTECPYTAEQILDEQFWPNN